LSLHLRRTLLGRVVVERGSSLSGRHRNFAPHLVETFRRSGENVSEKHGQNPYPLRGYREAWT
jgi:hypothetical protein